VELVTENIPEIVTAGTFSQWIGSESLTFTQHVEQLRSWLVDCGETELDGALGYTERYVRDYLGFMRGDRAEVLLKEWEQMRSVEWQRLMRGVLIKFEPFCSANEPGI
jgi:hypothetical protein